MTPEVLCTIGSFAQAQVKIGTCRFEVSETCRFAVLRIRNGYGIRPQADLDFPPPEFEGTATADLMGGTGFKLVGSHEPLYDRPSSACTCLV